MLCLPENIPVFLLHFPLCTTGCFRLEGKQKHKDVSISVHLRLFFHSETVCHKYTKFLLPLLLQHGLPVLHFQIRLMSDHLHNMPSFQNPCFPAGSPRCRSDYICLQLFPFPAEPYHRITRLQHDINKDIHVL